MIGQKLIRETTILEKDHMFKGAHIPVKASAF
jgi:hypothetical protein